MSRSPFVGAHECLVRCVMSSFWDHTPGVNRSRLAGARFITSVLCRLALSKMFEKYTEKARRVIFFARYEVSQFGSKSIEPEHLLLGLLREDKSLAECFLPADVSIEMFREQIEAHMTKGGRIPTAVEIPLSDVSKGVLKYAEEESTNLRHRYIGTDHLLLGLLREKHSIAERVLRSNGVNLSDVRQQIGKRYG